MFIANYCRIIAILEEDEKKARDGEISESLPVIGQFDQVCHPMGKTFQRSARCLNCGL